MAFDICQKANRLRYDIPLIIQNGEVALLQLIKLLRQEPAYVYLLPSDGLEI